MPGRVRERSICTSIFGRDKRRANVVEITSGGRDRRETNHMDVQWFGRNDAEYYGYTPNFGILLQE